MGHSSQVRGKAACADRHFSQSKWPSARIVDIDIDTRTCSAARPSFVLTQTYCVLESARRVVLGTLGVSVRFLFLFSQDKVPGVKPMD